MKSKLSILLLVMAVGIASAQTVELKPNYFDATVSYDAATGIAAVDAYGDMLLINNGSGITPETTKLNCAVMNFLLPAIPEETHLQSASFTATSVRKDAGVDSNGDLYGIDFRVEDKALGTDFYAGPFALGPNAVKGSDWGIMDDMFHVDDPSNGTGEQITTKTTDAAANAQLLAFLKKQYQDGAVNNYVFLRLSLDNLASAAWQRYSIASEANATYAPKLTLNFESGSSVELVHGANFVVYPNASKQIIVDGRDVQNGKMEVVALDGKVVYTQNLHGLSNTTATAFASGAYIVRVTDINGKVGTQKIVIN